jgi:hypothetical protein
VHHGDWAMPLTIHVIMLAATLVMFVLGTFFPGAMRRRSAAHVQRMLPSTLIAAIYGSAWFNIVIVAWGLAAGGLSVLLGFALLRRLGLV